MNQKEPFQIFELSQTVIRGQNRLHSFLTGYSNPDVGS